MSYGRPNDSDYSAADEHRDALRDPLPIHRGRDEKRIAGTWHDEADVPDRDDA